MTMLVLVIPWNKVLPENFIVTGVVENFCACMELGASCSFLKQQTTRLLMLMTKVFLVLLKIIWMAFVIPVCVCVRVSDLQ
jgi:hypothetical protein